MTVARCLWLSIALVAVFCASERRNASMEQNRESLLRAWLHERYGPPVFVGRVRVGYDETISGTAATRLDIDDCGQRARVVRLHPSVAYDEQYLVHELWHALYQSDTLLTNAPRFFVEGEAALAQFEYVNTHLGSGDTLSFIAKEIRAVRSRLASYAPDYEWVIKDRSRDERMLDYLYAGHLVADAGSRGIDLRTVVEQYVAQGGQPSWTDFRSYVSTQHCFVWQYVQAWEVQVQATSGREER